MSAQCPHGQPVACLACVIRSWPSDHMTIGDSARMADKEGAGDARAE